MAKNIRILIDTGHPSDVHLFKNLAYALQDKGNNVLFTARDRECSLQLLQQYGFDTVPLGKIYKNLRGKAKGLLKFSYRILEAAKRFKPDLLLSHGSMYAALVSCLIRKPHISMEDTGNLEQILLYNPCTEAVLSPRCLKLDLGKKHIKYDGYSELAYLNPKYFTPDGSILDALGVFKGEKFAIVRFADYSPTHYFGHKRLPAGNRIECIRRLSKYAKIYISSQNELPPYLEKFRIKIPPEKMHDVIYHASLVYTEGATMASEASILGTPAVYVYFKIQDYTQDQEERYGTIFNFGNSRSQRETSVEKAIELLKRTHIKEEWSQKRKKILDDAIDVTSFLTWFLEDYPSSFEIMKNNSEFQDKFK